MLWRTNDNAPPAKRYIGSPYDTDARYAKKGAATGIIHAALAERGLLPSIHIARTDHSTYVNAELLVDARQRYGVDLVGPTRGDNHWQLKNGQGFAARDFGVDFERQEATCPAGQTSTCWTTALTHSGKPVIKVKFSSKVCRRCPVASQCTDSMPPRRTISIRPQTEYEASRCCARVERVRRRETTTPSTPGAPVSRAPSPKRCARLQRGALPTPARSKRTWRI